MEHRVVVIGGGHAGIEAALASARLGVPTTLVTLAREWIGRMPCNPAVGGLAKGHLVREIDALGGAMGRLTDRATIQFKQLNTRKGLAVRSSRAQVDRFCYALEAQRALEREPCATVLVDSAIGLRQAGDEICGVVTARHGTVAADSVVVATGTFLGGRVIVGRMQYAAGRTGEGSEDRMSRDLAEHGLTLQRMKTGTTPRLLRSSVRWDSLPVQDEDLEGEQFSYYGDAPSLPRQRCRVTHTNARTHALIRDNLHLAPLFDGTIEGVGPRYCPSIEDKVVRFAQREQHRLYLEPEGIDSQEVYPNGLSTSLPVAVQIPMVQTIEGLERAVVVRPGYAIEYDFADPRQLRRTLEVRSLRGLFMAGQVNGTTGYEEAAAQGLIAGINAARRARGEEAVTIDRSEAYIGVLIDDLVTRGTDEPYRMFTSRSEYRLLLREGNADLRLSELGHRLGLLDDEAHGRFRSRRDAVAQAHARLASCKLRTGPELRAWCEARALPVPRESIPLTVLLRRPGIELGMLQPWLPEIGQWRPDVVREVESQIKYAGYIERQQRQVRQMRRTAAIRIPEDLDYQAVHGLSFEVREKLQRVRPEDLGQAERIPGITPAAITALLAHVQVHRRGEERS